MRAVIVKRLLTVIPMLFIVSLMVFSMVQLVPGDAAVAVAGENASPELIERTRERLGLNDPILQQYLTWVGGAIQGDFGTSLFSSRTVMGLILDRVPATVSLAAGATTFAILIGVPVGILAARRRGGWADRIATLGATLGVAVPNYFVALLLVLFFALWNPWLPATGYVPLTEDPVLWLKHLLLPSVALGAAPAAIITRQVRGAMVETMLQDYVRTARAKGLRTWAVTYKHALKNAAIPVVTVMGVQFSFLLGGTVIIESIFGLPGLGSLAIGAVTARDLPLIQGIVVVTTLIVLVVNLLVDISYGLLDPKVRAQ